MSRFMEVVAAVTIGALVVLALSLIALAIVATWAGISELTS